MKNFYMGLAALTVMTLVSVSDADAGWRRHRGHGDCCGHEASCCAPAPSCCAPAPSCCAPAPTCCAPAPSCCAPACNSCAPAYGAGYGGCSSCTGGGYGPAPHGGNVAPQPGPGPGPTPVPVNPNNVQPRDPNPANLPLQNQR